MVLKVYFDLNHHISTTKHKVRSYLFYLLFLNLFFLDVERVCIL